MGSPVVANSLVAVEDHALTASSLQVVGGRQAGLAGADDRGFDVFDRHGNLR
jgi:hypothetical protein